jgi:uncharacterized protein YutD
VIKLIIEVENSKYKLIKNYREAFDKEEFLQKYTSFFEMYDYIVGDIAYSKLRLKGFAVKGNKVFNKINDYSKVDKYIKENCAFDCKYYILEKIKEENSVKNN